MPKRRQRRPRPPAALGFPAVVEEEAARREPGRGDLRRESAAVAPAAPAHAAPAVIKPFELPTDELQAVAEAAGLQWVNSDAEKIPRRAGGDGQRAEAASACRARSSRSS